jgi:anaerobic magnesium-protoporphyrin IX monomethyl ester cyclase
MTPILIYIVPIHFSPAMDFMGIKAPHKNLAFYYEYDNNLPSLSILAILAFLRENGMEVGYIDFPVKKWGWQTAAKVVQRLNTLAIGMSGPATWIDENLRFARLLKEANPNMIIIHGGPFATLYPQGLLWEGSPIDFVVYGEGEETSLELMRVIKTPSQRKDFSEVRGIAYWENGHIRYTSPRKLIEDLDSLPIPAYDLLDWNVFRQEKGLLGACMHAYHSKGCMASCSFCSCWQTNGPITLQENPARLCFRSRWRTKSVKRTMEELTVIQGFRKHDYIRWCDDTWNASNKWNEEWAVEHKAHGFELFHSTFSRIDMVARDIVKGTFDRMVKNGGFTYLMIGLETNQENAMQSFSKGVSVNLGTKTCKYIRQHYPEVFLHTHIMSGLWDDDEHTMMELMKYVRSIGVDWPVFSLITPFPGTQVYQQYRERGYLQNLKKFGNFDMGTPIVPTRYLTTEQVGKLIARSKYLYILNPLWFARGFLGRKRSARMMYWNFLKLFVKILSTNVPILKILKGENRGTVEEPLGSKLYEPWWYTQ